LALRMHAFIDAYDDQVAGAIKDLGTQGADPSPA
jgi:hypothetical protein